MIRSIVIILAILQCSSQAFLPNEEAHQPNSPGFAIRITQKTLDHGVEKGLDLLSQSLQHLVIPDIDQTFLLGTRVKLSRTQLKRCDKPELKVVIVENRDRSESPSHSPIFNDRFGQNETSVNVRSNDSLIPNVKRIRTERGAGTLWFDESYNPGNTNAGIGGLTFSLSGVNVDVESSAEIHLKLLFSTSEDKFDFYLTLRDTSLNLTAYVGENRGTFKLSSVECVAEGDIRVVVNGNVSQTVHNYLADSSFVQGVFFGKLCDEITLKLKDSFEANVPQSLAGPLQFFPALTFDYSLTEAPIFRQNYLETRHAGTFQPTNNFQNWPFRPRPIQELEDTSRMFYVFLTDYTLNTLWQTAYLSDRLKWTITQLDLDRLYSQPDNARYAAPFRDFMNLLSPNEPVDVQVTIKSPPHEVFKINGRKLTINVEAYTAFFKDNPFPTKILELDTVVNCEAEVILTDRKLSFELNQFDVSSRIIYSGNDVPAQELSSKLTSATTPTFQGLLRDIGREGITFPNVPYFNFANLHIFEDTSGVLVVGTDYDIGNFMAGV